MWTRLTKPYDRSPAGRDARQLLPDPDRHLYCATQSRHSLVLSLFNRRTADNCHGFPFFSVSAAWRFLSLAPCVCLCFQVTHVFWKCFCLGLISSSFTTLSLTLIPLLSPSSISQSQGLKARPGMIISWLLLFSEEQCTRFFQSLDEGRRKYVKEREREQ